MKGRREGEMGKGGLEKGKVNERKGEKAISRRGRMQKCCWEVGGGGPNHPCRYEIAHNVLSLWKWCT